MTLLIIYLSVAMLAGLVALWLPVRLPQGLWLLALAALPQFLAIVGIRHSALALLSLTLCMAWGWRNRSISGVGLLIVGLGLNLLAMALYGGSMPITTARLTDLGIAVPPGSILLGAKDIAVDSSPIWWLGDWMTVRWAPYAVTASPGDLLVVAGLVRWLIVSAHIARRSAYDLSYPEFVGTLPAAESAKR
ncbi:MAG: DUF5317 domain-containing protein [Oscillochloris sp.]|nr:DUF5317 domain-containing protein [Oscillochloris sp.]